MLSIAQIHHSDMVPIIAICIGGGVAIFWVFCVTIHEMSKRRQIERSRREIAAYIAEGSMTPEEGERLLKAGPDKTT